ncbi:MAG: acylphosphatase [Devosia sp.]
MSKAVLVRITGRVQGVGYRYWTWREAQRRGLSGWVRNRLDGSVEALIAGPDTIVEEMLRALWTGPEASAVTAVEHDPTELPDQTGFDRRPTA